MAEDDDDLVMKIYGLEADLIKAKEMYFEKSADLDKKCSELRQMNKENKELKLAIKEMQEKISLLKDEKISLSEMSNKGLEEKDKELERKDNEKEKLRTAIEELRKEISSKAEENETLSQSSKKGLEEKDKELEQKNNENRELQRTIEEQKRQISLKTQEIDEIQKKLNKEIKQKELEKESSQNEINKLQEEVNNCKELQIKASKNLKADIGSIKNSMAVLIKQIYHLEMGADGLTEEKETSKIEEGLGELLKKTLTMDIMSGEGTIKNETYKSNEENSSLTYRF